MTDQTPAQKPKEWLEKAIALHDDRRFDEAKSLYLKVLEVHPHHAGTRHMLGLAEHESGNFNGAIDQLKKAAAAEPRNAIYAGNLAVAYHARGDGERAVTAYKRALAIDPSMAALHHHLGRALHQNGDHLGAIDSFRKALALDARFADAEADLGLSLLQIGEPEKAVSHFKRALALQPAHPQALTQLGLAYIETGRKSAAIDALNKALALTPDAEIYARLGDILYDVARLDEAIAAFSHALALRPEDVDLICKIARSEAKRSQPDQAEQLYRAAISAGDTRADTYFALGNILLAFNRQHEAVQNYRWAIKSDPDYAPAHRMVAFATRHVEENKDIQAVRDALSRTPAGSPARMHLSFALGKIEEDLGNYESAFSHFEGANRLQRQTLTYDAYQTRHWAEAIMKLFDDNLFALNKNVGQPDPSPLFIVGMPQAGAQEVAEILSAHPAIFSAGELPIVSPILAEAGLSDPETLISDRLASWEPAKIAELGRTYLSRSKHLAPDAKFIVNSLPSNFWYLGIIKQMLPNARIIHCTRTPVDNCLAIFCSFLPEPDAGFACDLGELGANYRVYQRLMQHWHAHLPGQIVEVDHHTLSTDLEGESRRLLTVLGLEWDASMLAKETPGAADKHGSADVAAHYGEALRPLIEALEDAG